MAIADGEVSFTTMVDLKVKETISRIYLTHLSREAEKFRVVAHHRQCSEEEDSGIYSVESDGGFKLPSIEYSNTEKDKFFINTHEHQDTLREPRIEPDPDALEFGEIYILLLFLFTGFLDLFCC